MNAPPPPVVSGIHFLPNVPLKCLNLIPALSVMSANSTGEAGVGWETDVGLTAEVEASTGSRDGLHPASGTRVRRTDRFARAVERGVFSDAGRFIKAFRPSARTTGSTAGIA